MGFPTSVADDVLVRCGRHCCLCGKYMGQKIELHHIKQVADGGEDTADNCIPLCFDCHAEVKSYNPHNPKGRRFTEKELKGHRDKCYERYSIKNSGSTTLNIEKPKSIFPPQENMPLIRWGYPEQDKLRPVFPGNIVLVAGYTGTKKSTYLLYEEIMEENPFGKIRLSLRESSLLPRTIPVEDINKFFKTMYGQMHRTDLTDFQYKKALRDVAVIELLFATGVRVSELCNLTDASVNCKEGIIRIYGKGKKERMMYIENENVLEILKKYREHFIEQIRQNGY